MKKKIIFVTFCLILFLIFTALSYGDIDPKYKARGRPNQELLSPPGTPPPNGNQSDDVLLVIIRNWNGFFLVVCAKSESPKENPTLRSLTTQQLKSQGNNNVKRTR